MIALDFYYSTSKDYLLKLEESLRKATGDKKMSFDGRRLQLPESLASGYIDFYEFKGGISLVLTDCIFHQKLSLRQKAIEGNETYRIIFQLGENGPDIIQQSGATSKVGRDLAEAILFSSHSSELNSIAEKGSTVKTVSIIFHRLWGLKYLRENAIPLRETRLRLFANNMPMQFTTHMDLRCKELAGKMLTASYPQPVLHYLLEGCTYQLAALFFNNLVEDEVGEKRIMSQHAMRVIALKEHLEQHLYEPLLTLQEAAAKCLMGKSRFLEIFRSLFGSNYGAFFADLKMKKARELLDSGMPQAEVRHETGFTNPSHFVKAFKNYYGVTPGASRKKSP